MAMSTAKHFCECFRLFSRHRRDMRTPAHSHAHTIAAGYDVENFPGGDRASFNAIISQHDLSEYYWPPFRSAVQRAHVGSIMCSYNAVNGVPSCANGPFNNGIVRGQWQWPGFIVSDCGEAPLSRSHTRALFSRHHHDATTPPSPQAPSPTSRTRTTTPTTPTRRYR